MGMNTVPVSERMHISLFGKRNAGKSSVMNSLIGQSLAVVSPVKGTTTDPVYKTMEILPAGPVVIIDTPGFDDVGELGKLRSDRTWQVLNKTDLAVLIVTAGLPLSETEQNFLQILEEKAIKFLIVYNKIDLVADWRLPHVAAMGISAKTGQGINELREKLGQRCQSQITTKRLVGDLLSPSDFVILVVPIDQSAPKGRLILPQQQVIRDVLEAGAVSIVIRETELAEVLRTLEKPPRLVITDSQVFGQVSANTPSNILMTSFSILFARYKGNLLQALQGVNALDHIRSGNRILVAEGCTHHRQCDDIGTVKIPCWIREYTRSEPEFVFCSGGQFPEDLSPYHLIIHCGGCMLNTREMGYRLECAEQQDIPMTNYGILIAYMKGILERSLLPFSELAGELQK